MRTIILSSLIAVLGSVSGAFGQVDTLELVEIGSITLPHAITNLYVQDLDGDSLQEIILTDSSYAYVYDGLSRSLLWRSPQLQRPRDLQFGDLNGDSLIDMAVRDDQSIRLYDPHDSSMIWISPALDSIMYKCYTLGDIDEDGWADLLIANMEPFTRRWIYGNRDTVWISIYRGPAYSNMDSVIITMANYSFYDPYYPWTGYLYQAPYAMLIRRITGNDGLHNRLIVFSSKSDTLDYYFGEYYMSYGGEIWIIDIVSHTEYHNQSVGFLDASGDWPGSRSLLYTINGRKNHNYYHDSPDYAHTLHHLNVFSADTLLYSRVLFDHELYGDSVGPRLDWNGFIVDNLNLSNGYYEICFGSADSLKLIQIPTGARIWSTHGIDGLDSVISGINIASIADYPQILVKCATPLYGYKAFLGSNGALRTVILNHDIVISKIADIDHDHNDGLFAMQGSILRIYSLLPYVGVDESGPIPYTTSLSPNYPNPFNSRTTISFSLGEGGDAALEIFDILGRKVATLHRGKLAAGEYRVTWDASDAPSGVYFYRLRAADTEQTRRMMLVK